jgi:hypothetical protein
MFTLHFTTTAAALIVTGKTFPIKTQLKALGGIWNTPRWILPLSVDSPLLRANLVEECRVALIAEKAAAAAAEKARLAYKYSPEFIADALKAKADGESTYNWICCANCVVLDWERQHTRCTSCGADYGTHIESFFVKGRLRTGD